MKEINWGIIGCGRISHAFASALDKMNGASLYAVSSTNKHRLEEFQQKYHVEKGYLSYEELVKDNNVDAVYIATPHSFHKEHTLLALKHKKNVLCEKPFTINRMDAEEVYEFAKKQNVFIMEAMWTKFLPTIQKVKSWIREGLIGEIKMIHANFGFYSPFNPLDRLFNKDLAGGTLLDIGIYPITFVTTLLGKPTDIKTMVLMGVTNVDEQASILFYYPDGIIATMNPSFHTNLVNDAIIYGTKGKIIVPSFWMSTQAFRYSNEELIETFDHPHRINGYEYEIEEVNDCIRNNLKESQTHPLKDNLYVLTLMDLIRKEWNLKYPQD